MRVTLTEQPWPISCSIALVSAPLYYPLLPGGVIALPWDAQVRGYEWAALLCDHGAERVDVVHRHSTPRFAKVSWAFVDAYVDRTLAHRGWWRRLPAEEFGIDLCQQLRVQ